jgi:predicted N-acyltransferase
MIVETINNIASVAAQQWESLKGTENPFLCHAFLEALESSQSACKATGWHPLHTLVWKDENRTTLMGATVGYLKGHSYGEYIFDWAWADAFHRFGLEYYPKISIAVPFTPATGRRFLLAPNLDSNVEIQVQKQLLDYNTELASSEKTSSAHILFLEEQECDYFKDTPWIVRETHQYHWFNSSYANFDDFLLALNSRKRKQIKKERLSVLSQNIRIEQVTGQELTPQHIETFYQFYLRTISRYGAIAYLKKEFFLKIAESMSDKILLLLAYQDETCVAGAINFISPDCIYGRYWGCHQDIHNLHYEVCYYQPIEYAIKHRLNRFEAGAQGQHKICRGLVPSKTFSAHLITHPEFRNAIKEFVLEEKEQNQWTMGALQKRSPFKRNEP